MDPGLPLVARDDSVLRGVPLRHNLRFFSSERLQRESAKQISQ
jgi:hypothetical protein